jgi:hypothetical protein
VHFAWCVTSFTAQMKPPLVPWGGVSAHILVGVGGGPSLATPPVFKVSTHHCAGVQVMAPQGMPVVVVVEALGAADVEGAGAAMVVSGGGLGEETGEDAGVVVVVVVDGDSVRGVRSAPHETHASAANQNAPTLPNKWSPTMRTRRC